MLDHTFTVLRAHPITLLVLIGAIVLSAAIIVRSDSIRTHLSHLAKKAGIIAGKALAISLLLLFIAHFLAYLFGDPFHDLAAFVILAEQTLGFFAIAVMDAVLAAVLTVAWLVIIAVGTVLGRTVVMAIPIITASEFLFIMAGLEFLAGSGTMAAVYLSPTDSDADRILTGLGVTSAVAGLIVAPILEGGWALSAATFASALVLGTVGFALGMLIPIIVIEPTFGAPPVGHDHDEEPLPRFAEENDRGWVAWLQKRVRTFWVGDEE